MNPLHRLATSSRITHHRVTPRTLPFVALAACVLPFGGCSTPTALKIESAARVVYQDASSPAGQQLLADVSSSALNVGLDFTTGNDVGAAIAGIQGAASAMRDYEGLAAAPASTAIANAAAAGAGVTAVAATLAPSVTSLIDRARASAAQQKINLRTDDIIEALARGFDAVATTKIVPKTGHS